MNDKLNVEIRDGNLSISLPISTLQQAVECFSDFERWNEDAGAFDRPRITDAPVFAEEVLRQLRSENEDGSTPVTRLFDMVFHAAVDNGAEGIILPSDNEYQES